MSHPLKPRRAQVFGREVQFSKLSAAKVRPEYKPTFHEEYHSREAAEFAAEYYEERGTVLLHRKVRSIVVHTVSHTCPDCNETGKRPESKAD